MWVWVPQLALERESLYFTLIFESTAELSFLQSIFYLHTHPNSLLCFPFETSTICNTALPGAVPQFRDFSFFLFQPFSLPHLILECSVSMSSHSLTSSSTVSVAAAAAKSLQLCPTLCDPIDGSLPGSAVPGILQARTLEWVAVSFSNAWKWKVKVKSLSRVRL